jgi:ketosteroid isomerase-like protein
MRRIAILISITILASCATVTTLEADAELRERNQQYDRALLRADSAALAELYAPEFKYIGPEAVVRTREQQIHALTSGTVDVIAGASSEVDVKRYGTTAVLTGRFQGRARTTAGEFDFHERYSTVWVHRHGAWRLVLEHGSVVKTAP